MAAVVAGVLVVAAAAAVGYALVRYRRVWEVPLPATRAVQDPAVIARGRYIVYGPGRCADCHAAEAAGAPLDVPLTGGAGETTYLGTWRALNLTPDPATGIGNVTDAQLARMIRYTFFSGGLRFRSRLHPETMYVSPNLTPDTLTGDLTRWSEEDLIRRFRAGPVIPDSPMPWEGFSRMTDTDLRALYRFLHSLAPVRHDVGPTLQPLRGETPFAAPDSRPRLSVSIAASPNRLSDVNRLPICRVGSSHLEE